MTAAPPHRLADRHEADPPQPRSDTGRMTESDVLTYLLDRRLIDADAIVSGRIRVVDASRRNWNFRVVCDSGPSYLVKKGAGRDLFTSVRREASIYEALADDPRSAQLATFLPRVIAFDHDEDVLVLELFVGAEDLRGYHRRRGQFPRSIAAQVGQVLAKVHSTESFRDDAAATRLVSPEPAGLFLDRPGLGVLHELSAAATELIELVQRSRDLCEKLGDLRSMWRSRTFIHHDARWDNILVTRTRRGAPALKLVDWEAAGLGDPAWDLGGVFGDYVGLWVTSIPVTGHEAPDRYLQFAEYPLESMRPAVRACWEAYVRTADLRRADVDELLLRTAAFAGVKLIQTSLEYVQDRAECSMTAACLLQVGANMITRPRDASDALFGIASGAST